MASSTHSYDSRKLPTGEIRRFPMAAVLIHAGVLIGVNASGFAEAADSSSLAILGVSCDEYDNSAGSAGDLYCEVEVGVFTFANKSGDTVGWSDVGRPVYVSTTSAQGWYEIQSTAGASCCAGTLFGFDAETGRPLVDLRNVAGRGYMDVATAVAKNTTATLTAAEITNSGRGNALLKSNTSSGAVGLTTPTAAEILAAVPWLPIGGGVELVVQNEGGSNAITITGGTSVTVTTNNNTVAASTTGRFLLTRTAAAAVTLHRAG